jgi:hypothetical protein
VQHRHHVKEAVKNSENMAAVALEQLVKKSGYDGLDHAESETGDW